MGRDYRSYGSVPTGKVVRHSWFVGGTGPYSKECPAMPTQKSPLRLIGSMRAPSYTLNIFCMVPGQFEDCLAPFFIFMSSAKCLEYLAVCKTARHFANWLIFQASLSTPRQLWLSQQASCWLNECVLLWTESKSFWIYYISGKVETTTKGKPNLFLG